MEWARSLSNDPPGFLEFLREIAQETPGHILEIGTCRGASAHVFLEVLAQNPAGFLVTVDPWGGRPYPDAEHTYGDHFQREAIFRLASMAYLHQVNWHHFKLTSRQFFELDQISWYGGDEHANVWATVLLDGEHTADAVEMEIRAVFPHVATEGNIIVDNTNHGGSVEIHRRVRQIATELGLEFSPQTFHQQEMVVLRRK